MIDITYDIPLVILSAIIAVGAGFFTIEMSNEILLNKGVERWTWLIISAITMGMGIWGMHFIAMTAFSMGMEINYDFLIVLISLFAAIIGCVQGLYIITLPLVNLKTLIAASVTMGSAIAGMHYIGMAAMRVSATVSYDPIIVALSVIIAIVVSFAAMKIVISLRQMKKNSLYSLYKVIASLIMGGAVLSMHYTGMAAAKFKIDVSALLSLAGFLNSQVIGSSVGITVIGMFAIIYVVLLNASWNRSV